MVKPGMNQDTPMKRAALRVPGASLAYEVRGSGPVLLLMPGGPADAGVFGRIAPLLFRYPARHPKALRSKVEAVVGENR